MSIIELHCHTYYSDGRPSPGEVVESAAALGLRYLAITDHDSAHGSREARGLASQKDIRLIPAIEFTTRWDEAEMPAGESDVDLLGYFMDLESPAFLQAEGDGLTDFTERMRIWCGLLTQSGCSLSLEDVFAQNPRHPGTLQLVQAVLARGYAASWGAADALVRTCIHAIPPCARTIEVAVSVIHAAGGAAVLAHPAPRYLRWNGSRLGAAGLRRLVEIGLDGIEVFHPSLTGLDRAHFLELAGQFNLAVCGGSDEHGWEEGPSSLGSQPVSEAMLEALAARAQSGAPISPAESRKS